MVLIKQYFKGREAEMQTHTPVGYRRASQAKLGIGSHFPPLTFSLFCYYSSLELPPPTGLISSLSGGFAGWRWRR
jgi:hypothetical protein